VNIDSASQKYGLESIWSLGIIQRRL